MARSAFGGGGDYSSLFSSLYAQQKALKDQQQAALDKDAYDRWKNGLSSDDDWLTYIQGRVESTSGDKDPTDHQHWIQLQRQYVSSIADSQAEFAYSEGKASINELIAYYQGRLGRLQENSDEYRQLKGHVDDLVDKRDSDDLSTGAQQIAARIDRGQATYEDLLGFYKSHLTQLRPGSELFKQVQSEIVKVRGTISDSKLSGQFEKLQYLYESKKLSGRAYANKLQSMAQEFKASDPAKYYQILQAANRIRQSGGSGGGGGGGGTLTKQQRTHEDNLLKIDSYLDQFTDAYKAGARVIPDPAHPGQQIVLTPELIGEIDTQRLANYDKLAMLYKHAGDGSKYGSTLNKKTRYIVDYVQPHNTLDASQQWGQLVGAVSKQIAGAANTPDPEATLQKVVAGFQSMKAWLSAEVVKDGKIVKAEAQPSGDFIENSSNYIDQALAILGDPNMDSASRMAALSDLSSGLDTDAGAHYDKGTQTAMKDLLKNSGAIANGAYDLATGKKVLAITPEDGITLVDTRVQHTLGVDPNTGQSISVDLTAPDLQLGAGQRVQEVWIDRGGTPTKVYAVVDQAPSGYSVWVASKAVTIGRATFKKGAVITSDVVGQAAFQAAVQAGAVARQDAFAAAGMPLNYVQVPAYDDNGQHYDAVTWYQDPQTKLWHKGQPPVSSATLNPDGTVKIGKDGKLGINWMPYSNASGVVAPYAGSDKAAMQKLYDQGQVGTDPRYNQQTGYRDMAGNFTTDPTKSVTAPATMYFDARDDHESRRIALDSARTLTSSRESEISKIQDARDAKIASMGGPSRMDSDIAFEKTVLRTARTLGISIGESVQKTNDAIGIPGPDQSPQSRQKSIHGGKLRIGVPAKKTTDETFDVPLPPAARNTSSGPALANLPPGSGGTKIDADKVRPLQAPTSDRDEGHLKIGIPAPTKKSTAPKPIQRGQLEY